MSVREWTKEREERENGGPDWFSVHACIAAMHKHHNVTVVVKLEIDSASGSGAMRITVEAHAPVLVGPGTTYVAREVGSFPSWRYVTMPGAVHSLLHKVDRTLCGDIWDQGALL